MTGHAKSKYLAMSLYDLKVHSEPFIPPYEPESTPHSRRYELDVSVLDYACLYSTLPELLICTDTQNRNYSGEDSRRGIFIQRYGEEIHWHRADSRIFCRRELAPSYARVSLGGLTFFAMCAYSENLTP